MKDRVKIVDDTGRINECAVVYPHETHYMEVLSKLGLHGFKRTKKGQVRLHRGPVFLPLKMKGAMVQSTVSTEIVYEGAFLRNSITRAKRYIRNHGHDLSKPPRHIAMALAAFLKADPEGFKSAMEAS